MPVMRRIAPYLLLAALGVAFCRPLLKNPENWGVHDWDYFFFHYGIARETVVTYHQVPLWNPYSLGGTPLISQGHTGVFSPVFLLILLLGVPLGLKVAVILYMVAGLWGMHLLARHLGLGPLSSLLAAFLWMFSSWFPLHSAMGHVPVPFANATIPWAVFFFLKGLTNLRHAVVCGIVVALMALQGGFYPVVYTALFLGVYSLLMLPREGIRAWWRYPVVALVSGVFSVLLSAIKVLPFYNLLMGKTRNAPFNQTFALSDMLHWFLDRNQADMGMHWPSQAGYWHIYGDYVGLLPLGLFLLGTILLWRRWWPWIISAWFFFLVTKGNFHPWAPSNLIHALPLASGLARTSEVRALFTMPFAIVAAALLSRLETSPITRLSLGLGSLFWRIPGVFLRHGIPLVLTLLILTDLFWVNSPIYKIAFPVPPQAEMDRSVSFHHTGYTTAYAGNKLYEFFLHNEGVIHAPDTFTDWERIPIQPYDGAGYRGEAYLAGGRGEARMISWSPNRLTIQVRTSGEDRLILNQRFMPGWQRTDGRPVEASQGLISTPVQAGESEATVFYRPREFAWGAALSCLGLFLAVLFWFGYHKARARLKEGFLVRAILLSLILGLLFPEVVQARETVIATDGTWRCSLKEETGWTTTTFDDRSWTPASAPHPFVFGYHFDPRLWKPPSRGLPMWIHSVSPGGSDAAFCRKAFTLSGLVEGQALLRIASPSDGVGEGGAELYLNGQAVPKSLARLVIEPTEPPFTTQYYAYDIAQHLQEGSNLIALKGIHTNPNSSRAIFMDVKIETVTVQDLLLQRLLTIQRLLTLLVVLVSLALLILFGRPAGHVVRRAVAGTAAGIRWLKGKIRIEVERE